MGKHTNISHPSVTGRDSQPPGKHRTGIGMLPVGDRSRGDYTKDTIGERPNNDPHIRL